MLRWSEFARSVVRLAWPVLVAQLVESVYALSDTYFVSRLGYRALAAVALGSYATMLLSAVVALVSTGASVVVAQTYGAGRIDEVRRAVGNSAVLSLAISIPVAVTSYLAAQDVVSLIGGKGEVSALAIQYLKIRSLGIIATSLAMAFDSSLRALGATKQSMIVNVSSVLLNIALDPLLILGLLGLPSMGVAGAALATVLSIAYMIPVELLYLRRLNAAPRVSIDFGIVRKLVVVGGPTAIERLVFAVGNNAYIATISRCGSEALAAHQVGLRIESFVYMPGFAFSVAASVLVGQGVGASRLAEAKKLGLEAAKIATLLLGISGVALAVLAPALVKPFPSHRTRPWPT